MTGADAIESVEVFIVALTQKTPYLGNLRHGETVHPNGYFVRRRNRTVYPVSNRSLVVRVRTRDGVVGWGETYGLVAPQAPAAIINDLLAGFLIGRDPRQCEPIHDELYDLMRVRGYTGGFYLDALAAVDISLWDIAGKIADQPISELLGGRQRDRVAAYVSGLPEDTLRQRCELANSWSDRGFHSFKFALPVADQGPANELKSLRETLGPNVKIAADLHWAFSPDEAIDLSRQLDEYHPWFLEAPVATEDIEGLRRVAKESGQPIAAGEEWRTIHEARLRIDRDACAIVQPEMGHTGITQFMRIGRYAERMGLQVIPHATIGSGIFLAASLQASAALSQVASHEYQHSVMDEFRHFTGDVLDCSSGFYMVPSGPGLGLEPSAAMRANMERVDP